MSGKVAPGGRGKKKGGVSVSRSVRAGLIFPVGRLQTKLRKSGYAKRVGSGAPVFLAAVLEYLSAEIFELAGNNARDHKRSRITPRDVQTAIRMDSEFDHMLRRVTIASGGVMPHIHQSLVPTKKEKKPKAVKQEQVVAAE